MKWPQESVPTARLTDHRKDLVAAGLFLGLCLLALFFLRLEHVPLSQPIYKTSILRHFTKDLFIFKPN